MSALRLLVMGASGSGTSTLGRALASTLGWSHFDADHYYWLPTSPAFTTKRESGERGRLFSDVLGASGSAIVSGSIMGWDRTLEDSFALIVFLTVPTAIRIARLREREIAQLGHADPAFLEWASLYDEGPREGRSLAKHRQWLSERKCPVLSIDGEVTVPAATAAVLQALHDLAITGGTQVPGSDMARNGP